jgi:phage-related protein
MDGWVTIGTELDTEQLEQDIKNAKKELTAFQKEEEKLLKEKGKIEVDVKEYEKAQYNLDMISNKIKKLKAEQKGLFVDGSLSESQRKTYEELQSQIEQAKNKQAELKNETSSTKQKNKENVKKLAEINQKLKENQINQGLVNNKIEEANKKLAQSEGYAKVKEEISSINDKMSGAIRKVAKWALAVFSVRSAYSLVRQASSTLSQYNEQYASDLEYIKYVLAQALAPVLQYLVKLAYQLLTYINYIAKAWFNVNLFGNASAKSFQSMKNSASSTAKSAKEIKNSLAGFDEMNILSDNTTSSSSTSSGAVAPSVDLSNLDVEIPEWLQWIADNKDKVLGFFTTLGVVIASIKITEFLDKLGLIGEGINNIDIIIKGLGIGLILYGVYETIKGITDFIADPSWENFLTILQGIALVVAGIALVMGNWIVAVIALGVALVTYIIKNWDSISEILGQIGDWIYENVITPVWNFIKAFGDTIWSFIKLIVSGIQAIFTTLINILINPFVILKDTVVGVFNGIVTTVKGVFNVIKGLFTGDWRTVMNGFKQIFKGAFDTLWTIAKAPINLIIGGINALIKGINKISFDVPDWVPVIGGQKWGFNIPTIPKLATGGIINMPRKRSTSWWSNSTVKQEEKV